MPDNRSFTTHFMNVAAGDVHVPGLPAGSAGSRSIGHSLLSSIAAIFHISPDIASYLPPATVSIALTPVTKRVFQQLDVPEYGAYAGDMLSTGD